jgi:hypothetical protein
MGEVLLSIGSLTAPIEADRWAHYFFAIQGGCGRCGCIMLSAAGGLKPVSLRL